jgi:NAD(P)-binding Rossmann-like domain
MNHITTDYLIIGAGASGMSFADTLLTETDAHITIVDRHAKPGGHWNDSYSFVTLHQPSSFYGVNSTELSSQSKDTHGVNKGLYSLASGTEVSSYYERVMNQTLLPSGRVSYFPMSDHVGDGRIKSILSGAETQVTVRKKTVDSTYFGPTVPSTHTPKFKVAADAWMVSPNALAQLWQAPREVGRERPRHFTIIGAGKTAMDVGVWLLNAGAAPENISWVMPRDSWLVNRLQTQPGLDFFIESIGGQANQMEAMAKATSVADLFERLEACDAMLRIHPDQTPTMFHYATISKAEVESLRRITNVIRKGRVQAVEAKALVMDGGRVELPPHNLCIDCTASAVEKRPAPPQPVFEGNKILLQMVRIPMPSFSAALIAYVEAHYGNEAGDGDVREGGNLGDAKKNQLCGAVAFPDSLTGYVASTFGNMRNQFVWSQDKTLRTWIRESRLDGFGKVVAAVSRDDAAKQAVLERLKTNAMAAMGNMPKLMAGAAGR